MSDEENAYERTAEWLLTREAPGARDVRELAAAAERLCRRLEAALHDIIGDEGFRAIVARAQHLAQPAHPWLAEMPLADGGECLGRLAEATAGQAPDEARRGLAALFANALQVLSSLVTPEIVLGQVEFAWPELPQPIVQAAVREGER